MVPKLPRTILLVVVATTVILGLGPLLISSSDWQSFTTKGGIANYFGQNAVAEDYFNRTLAVAEDNRQFPNASRVLLILMRRMGFNHG
jgi:hypothetical protein